MELKDYTTEQLRAELKRRNSELKAQRNKIKRCKMCKHWGEVNYYGIPTTKDTLYGINRCCQFFLRTKSKKYYKCHNPYQVACEHFEKIDK